MTAFSLSFFVKKFANIWDLSRNPSLSTKCEKCWKGWGKNCKLRQRKNISILFFYFLSSSVGLKSGFLQVFLLKGLEDLLVDNISDIKIFYNGKIILSDGIEYLNSLLKNNSRTYLVTGKTVWIWCPWIHAVTLQYLGLGCLFNSIDPFRVRV